MPPILGQYGVKVVALSPDTPAQAAKHRTRDDLKCDLMCDPGLTVIRRFGLVDRRVLVHRMVGVFGLPLGIPTGLRKLAIPTTLLIDENGVVRWIDQATTSIGSLTRRSSASA